MLRLLKKISKDTWYFFRDPRCVRGCVGLKYTDIPFIWFIFGIMPRLCLKNDCPSEITIEIDHTENTRLHLVTCDVSAWMVGWKSGRLVSILAVHRSRARENTRLSRDTAIVAWSNTNVNFCVASLRNRSKKYAVRDFCPGVLRLKFRIAVGTSGFVKHYSVSYQTLNCTKERESKESFIMPFLTLWKRNI